VFPLYRQFRRRAGDCAGDISESVFKIVSVGTTREVCMLVESDCGEFVEQIEKMRQQAEGCMKNLLAISDALRTHQQEHHILPGSLEELYPEYLSKFQLKSCTFYAFER